MQSPVMPASVFKHCSDWQPVVNEASIFDMHCAFVSERINDSRSSACFHSLTRGFAATSAQVSAKHMLRDKATDVNLGETLNRLSID